MGIPRSRRTAAALVLSTLTLPLGSCFDPPVRQAIDLAFDANGGLEVRVETWLEPESHYGSRPKARERIAAASEEARCGDDAWSRQLALLSPASLQRSLRHRDGALREVSLSASFPDARAAERIFEAHPLSVSLSRGEAWAQLEILPGRASRATAGERREVDQALGRFAAAASGYLSALAELYSYLDEAPGRERPVFAELLSLSRPGGGTPSVPEKEERLVAAVEEAMSSVHEFLRLDDGRGESLDELSRRVFDPFPASLSVSVAGRVEESTGFVRGANEGYRVPSVGLFGTLAGLSDRWVRPDPLAALVESEARPGKEIDLDVFLERGRAVLHRPSADEVRDAVEQALAPRPVYRLRWTRAPAPSPTR